MTAINLPFVFWILPHRIASFARLSGKNLAGGAIAIVFQPCSSLGFFKTIEAAGQLLYETDGSFGRKVFRSGQLVSLDLFEIQKVGALLHLHQGGHRFDSIPQIL
jgi:hypothetical protein